MLVFNWFFSICFSFILLGLYEGIVKPAAIHWTRRRLLLWTPIVLAYLDEIFPALLESRTFVDVEKLVRIKFSELTGEDWSAVDLTYFWETYDPRITLSKLHTT